MSSLWITKNTIHHIKHRMTHSLWILQRLDTAVQLYICFCLHTEDCCSVDDDCLDFTQNFKDIMMKKFNIDIFDSLKTTKPKKQKKADWGNGTKKSQLAQNCSFKTTIRGKTGRWSPMKNGPLFHKNKPNVQKMTINSFACASWLKMLMWKDANASTNSCPKQEKPSTSSSKSVNEEHSRGTRKNRIFRKRQGKNNCRGQQCINCWPRTYLPFLHPALKTTSLSTRNDQESACGRKWASQQTQTRRNSNAHQQSTCHLQR